MYDDFDSFFEEFEKLRKRLLREFFEDIDEEDFEKLEQDGWIIRRISAPGTHGFVARKIITGGSPITGGRLRELKNENLLYDVYDQGDHIEIYVDLPGEKEENILVSAGEDWVMVETPTYKKKIYLKSKIKPDTLVKKYVNGVLRISVKKQ